MYNYTLYLFHTLRNYALIIFRLFSINSTISVHNLKILFSVIMTLDLSITCIYYNFCFNNFCNKTVTLLRDEDTKSYIFLLVLSKY